MRKGPFVPKQFTATQWSKQDANAEFGSRLLHFIDSGFKQMFGHEEAVLAVVEYVWTHCPLQPGDFLGGSVSSKPPIWFVSSNICFVGPAMPIQSLPSVTSSAHFRSARSDLSRYRVIMEQLFERGRGSARRVRSEVPRFSL